MGMSKMTDQSQSRRACALTGNKQCGHLPDLYPVPTRHLTHVNDSYVIDSISVLHDSHHMEDFAGNSGFSLSALCALLVLGFATRLLVYVALVVMDRNRRK